MNSSFSNNLEPLESIDSEIAQLLLRRVELVAARDKLGGSLSLDEILRWEYCCERRIVSSLPSNVKHEYVTRTLHAIWNSSRYELAQSLPKVACLGPPGTFSHLIALRLFTDRADFNLRNSTRDIVDSVIAGESNFGIVSVSNTRTGPIIESLEILDDAFSTGVRIVEAHQLAIELSLLGYRECDSVRRIYGPSQALSQCRERLSDLIQEISMSGNEVEIIEVHSTSEAVRIACMDFSGNSFAIADKASGEACGLKVVRQSFEDRAGIVTQFFVIARDSTLVASSGRELTSLVFQLESQDKPGALLQALQLLSGLNLTSIHSWLSITNRLEAAERPAYRFFVEFEGATSQSRVQQAISDLRLVSSLGYPKVLGCYLSSELPDRLD